MVTLRFTYHEIMDVDFTAVDIHVFDSKKKGVLHYRNYDPTVYSGDIYANQTEEFKLPSLKAAVAFIESSNEYHTAR